MAQSGYTPIQHYRTTVEGAAPSASNLTAGELGFNINEADMALYAKNNSGIVKRIMNNPAGLKYPTIDGSAADQVLKTDGAGNLAFLALTESRALVSSASGGLDVSAVTSTELGYVSGVTSAIQTQLNAKVDEVDSTDNAIVRFNGTDGAVQNSSVTIDDEGNLGIGISTPTAKLDVVGDIKATGSLILRNGDSVPPLAPANGFINIADSELKFFCDLDGDGDYDADIYGRNNLYVAGENSIHFRIAPQQTNEGRIRLAATTDTNFIQSGRDYDGTTIKNLAFSPYNSTNYWAFFSHSSGFMVVGNSASPIAPFHVYNTQATPAAFENTASGISRIGLKGSTTTSGTTVTVGCSTDDLVMRAGGTDYMFVLSTGVVHPGTDNMQSLGASSFRWATVFAGTGTINTSDARDKTFLDIENAEKAAALEIKANLRKFKFNAAVKAKGDDARIHFGASAQQVGEIMASHGLDASKYGFYCYDEWDAKYDENGVEVVSAGNKYGVRYDELLTFIIGAM